MRFTSLVLVAGSAALASAQMTWFGINESGPEFGEGAYPGTLGTDYIWPDKGTIDTFIGQGFNVFRLNFAMERLTPDGLTAAPDGAYMGALKDIATHITSQGKYAMIQPHNYGRYYDAVITDTEGFKTWWTTVASQFIDNDLIIFDINNEFHDMDQDLVVSLNQAGIDGIRAAGCSEQYITPEGNSWTGAWTWQSSGNADTMCQLVDPENKLVFQMHQYLDTDGSGTNAECVSSTIFSERVTEATTWLRDNGFMGFIGEYAGGVNDQCMDAVKDGLQYLSDNSDVWMGAAWWAAGPWWADYLFSMEPGTGCAYDTYVPLIQPFFSPAEA